MKNAIKEYIEYSETEKKELWDKATFAFDTNVFLNLYRYSNKTRDQLLEAIEKLKPRIWMPYQVAYEFCKDRYSVIEESNKRFEEIEKSIAKLIQDWKQNLRLEDTDQDIKKLQEDMGKWIKDKKEKSYISFDIFNDSIFNKLLELFDGATGDELSIEDRAAIEKEGEERFSHKIPPGFKDKAKTENKYGDLLVWKEIIKYSKEKSVDIIFVTHDQKDDWWNTISGKTIGPRVELRKEFYKETQKKFHMYTMTSFLSFFNNTREDTIDKETIQEVETISKKFTSEILSKEEEPIYAVSAGKLIRNDDGTVFYKLNTDEKWLSSLATFKYENGKLMKTPNEESYSSIIATPAYTSPILLTRPEFYTAVIPKDEIVIDHSASSVLATTSDLQAGIVNPLVTTAIEKKGEKEKK